MLNYEHHLHYNVCDITNSGEKCVFSANYFLTRQRWAAAACGKHERIERGGETTPGLGAEKCAEKLRASPWTPGVCG